MIGELDVYGVFVPALFVWMVVAFALSLGARRALAGRGAYRFIWHRPLFDLALYVALVGLVVAIVTWI